MRLSWALLILAACGARASLEIGATGSGGAASSGGSASVGPGVGPGGRSGPGGAEPATGGGVATGGAPALGCSPDLRWIYDDNGVGVQGCSPEAGCAAGACVDPCEAAEAAKANFGCDFAFPASETVPGVPAQCFAIAVENTWDRPVALSLSRGSQTFDVPSIALIPNDLSPFYWYELPDGELPVGAVAVVYLASTDTGTGPSACPILPAMPNISDLHLGGTGRGLAWRLTADAPVAVWTMMPAPSTFQASSYTNAAQLLPTGAWGDDHVAILAPEKTTTSPFPYGPHYLMAVASQEDTFVTLSPTVSVSGTNDVTAAPAGGTVGYLLQAGELIEWSVPAGELTGTTITSDKPIGVWSGSRRACITTATTDFETCGDTFEQIPAVDTLGHDYVALPHPSRLPGNQPEQIRYRLVGVRGGTQLIFDPDIPGTPASLALGQIADFTTPLPFEVRSQGDDYPFYAAQMMSGCTAPIPNECYGSEQLVLLPDRSQLRRRWSFFVSPQSWQSDLVLLRQANAAGVFQDVDIACAGTVGGWQPLGTSGKLEWARLELVSFTNPVTCSAGAQLLFSNGLFGATLWATQNLGSSALSSFGLSGKAPDWIVF